jgi:hypothetical protein
MLGTIDNLNGLLTMNKIANIEVNVDELTTTSNLNGLLTRKYILPLLELRTTSNLNGLPTFNLLNLNGLLTSHVRSPKLTPPHNITRLSGYSKNYLEYFF